MFHKEGAKIILFSTVCVAAIILLLDEFIDFFWLKKIIQVAALLFLILILQFFRNPARKTTLEDKHIIAPADGKIVIIQEVIEPEYFEDKRLQVSIFMSPFNVHVTRFPLSGKILFSKYHPGKYLFAWLPKASTDNERTSIVVEGSAWGAIMYRQIAGALARRIINYAEENTYVKQGNDAGFIKFGSRVDLFLPIGTNLQVKLNQKVTGGETIIAIAKNEAK
jgi:phosphatidylserine decarboxylase